MRLIRTKAAVAGLGLALTMGLAAVTLVVVWRVNIPLTRDAVPVNIVAVWQSLPAPLRWLSAPSAACH